MKMAAIFPIVQMTLEKHRDPDCYEKLHQFLPISNILFCSPEAEFKEFEPRLKSAQTRFKLSAGLNLLTFNTILSGTNHI